MTGPANRDMAEAMTLKPPLALAVCAALAVAACARKESPPDPGLAFLAVNAHAPGVHVTASGLEYKILRSGPANGPRPKPADEVKVNYEGRLLDNTVFDSSYARGAPAVMTVSELVPGWIEALQLMRPGDIWQIWTPPALGYGDHGPGPIPPNSVLMFKLELIDIAPDPTSIGRG